MGRRGTYLKTLFSTWRETLYHSKIKEAFYSLLTDNALGRRKKSAGVSILFGKQIIVTSTSIERRHEASHGS